MARRTWRDEIGSAIEAALAEGRRRELADKALQAFVRENTGAWRSCAGYHGLKVWREEFRTRVKGLPRRRTRPKKAASGPAGTPGQGMLFD